MMNELSNFSGELLQSLSLFWPETTLVITFLITLFADLLSRHKNRLAGYITLAGLIVTGLLLLSQQGVAQTTFSGLLTVDPFSFFMRVTILLSAILVVLFSFSS